MSGRISNSTLLCAGILIAGGQSLAGAAPGAAADERPRADRRADERAIIQSEHALGQAFVTGDVGEVDRLLADDFVGVAPSGKTYDKSALLKIVRDGPNITSDEVGPVVVRCYGGAAVAQGSEHEVGPPPQRRAADRVWTDTWVRLGGRWRIVAAEDLDPARR